MSLWARLGCAEKLMAGLGLQVWPHGKRKATAVSPEYLHPEIF